MKITPVIMAIVIILAGFGDMVYSGENNKRDENTQSFRKTLYVGGTGPNNYTSIQDAIDNASDEDTIFVYSGIYYENINVNKEINLIGEDKNTTIIDGGKTGDVVYISADNVNISEFTVQNGGSYYYDAGIKLYNVQHCRIENIIITNNHYGIKLRYSSNNTISGNTITNNNWIGIGLSFSSNNTISGNTITNNNCDSIFLDYSNNNTISDNTITNNSHSGIWLYSSSNNNISGNTITNNWDGILVSYFSNNNIISSNTITNNNDDGIYLFSSSNNNIISGNTITNNDLGIYLSSSSNYNISSNTITNNSDWGICLDCFSNNNIISSNTITNNWGGIGLSFSSNNTISGNTITNNNWGIYPYSSSNNTISGNTITNSNWGIYLSSSSNNTISGNTITNNSDSGIYLSSSSNNNIISGNTITNNNWYGTKLRYSSNNNLLYHNNFLNNNHNAYDECSNYWDNGQEGNYWDDYNGSDTNGDGIGDTPYYIPGGNNKDNYPLMYPWVPEHPDLSISSHDITFSKVGDEIIINAKIHSYYSQCSNVDYWIIDVYNNKETIIEKSNISYIEKNGFALITKNVILENPENHKIKIIVDPYNKINEADERNNIAIRQIDVTEAYVLTDVKIDNKLYYVMFKPVPAYSYSEVKEMFDDKNPRFVDGIEELWIVDANHPNQRILDGEKIGKVLYAIINNYNKKNWPYYPYDTFYYPIECSEEINEKLRQKWIFEIFSISHWVDVIYKGIKNIKDEEERIKVWSAIFLGSASGYIPQQNLLNNIIGGAITALSFAIEAKSHYGSASPHFIIESEDFNYQSYISFLEKSEIKVKWSTDGNIISVTFSYYLYGYTEEYIKYSNGKWYALKDSMKEFAKLLGDINYNEFLTEILKDSRKNVYSFYEIHDIIHSSSIASLNRLRITRDILKQYIGKNSDFIKALNGCIKLAEQQVKVIEGYYQPTQNEFVNVFVKVLESIGETITKTIIEKALGVLVEKMTIEILRRAGISSISFGPLGTLTSVAEIASLVTAFLAGWDMGLNVANFENIVHHLEIAKYCYDFALHLVDAPSFMFIDASKYHPLSFYSSVLESMRLRLLGFGAFNTAMAKEDYLWGVGSWLFEKDVKTLRKNGKYLYDYAGMEEEILHSGFSLFNKLASKYSGISGANIIPPEYKDLYCSNTTIKIFDKPVNGRNVYVDIIKTKIGNGYIISINPFEIRNDEIRHVTHKKDAISKIWFILYSHDGTEIDFQPLYETDCLHDRLEFNDNYFGDPRTIRVSEEPTSIKLYYNTTIYSWWGLLKDTYCKVDTYSLEDIPTGSRNKNITYSHTMTRHDRIRGGSTSYYTWDSDNDTLNDAVTIIWNLSDFQWMGTAIVGARIMDNNGYIVAEYLDGNFGFTKNNAKFIFDFYANETGYYNATLLLFNSSIELINTTNISEIFLYKGQGDTSAKEMIIHYNWTVMDLNGDNVTDGVKLYLKMNATEVSKNCSILITCCNSSKLIWKNYAIYNLSISQTAVTFVIENLTQNNYTINIYLSDKNHYISDFLETKFLTGEYIKRTFTNYHDYGARENPYKYLSVKLDVFIEKAGNYTIIGYLDNSSGTYLGKAKTSFYAPVPGVYNVTLNFSASLLGIYGKDDYYILSRIILYNKSGIVSISSPNYITNFYAASDFEIPPISFINCSANTVDTNGDGYFEYLRINVLTYVNTAGNYTLKAKIVNKTEKLSIYAENTTNLTVGNHEVYFLLNGFTIRGFEQNMSYYVESIEVYNKTGNFIGAIHPWWWLGNYNYTNFQPILKIVDNYSECVIDTDSDGFYDYLCINFSINVTIPGNCTIKGDLYSQDETLIESCLEIFNLSNGIQNLSFLFNGSSIYRCSNLTSYILKDFNIYDEFGYLIDSRKIAYTTQTYDYRIFEKPEIIKCKVLNDTGVDINNNGLYDYLLVNISINVTLSGNYTLRGYLYSQNGEFICMASNSSFATTGECIISLFFSGYAINCAKINGSYNISIVEIYNENNQLIFANKTVYNTSIYTYLQFENMPFADLEIDSGDIHLSNDNLEAGEIISINVTVHNLGVLNASGILVEFYDNINGSLIDTIIIPILNASENVSVEISWQATYGNHDICVIVDPLGLIEESNESNNQAIKSIYVKPSIDYIAITFETKNEILDYNISANFSFIAFASAFNYTYGFIEFVEANWNLYNYANSSINSTHGKSIKFNSGNEDGIAILKAEYSNYNDTAVFTINSSLFSFYFYKGWNLITIPFHNNYAAKTLGENITGCSIISKWNASLQQYQSYLVGVSPPEFDFDIEDGIGYFIYVKNDTIFSISRNPIANVSIPLHIGWNLIGWFNNSTKASLLGQSITNCSIVSKWNASLQQYQSYLVGISPPEFDFVIKPGMGIFIYTTTESIWYGK